MLKKMQQILKLIIAGVISLVLLSVFVYFYKYTSTRVITPEAPTDFTWTPNKALNTMEEGFAWIKMDKNGYNNVHEKATGEQVDILLMGSSHLLGTEVAASENMGYLLNEQLPFRVYNIGMTGHFFSSCICNLKYALELYNPSKYVVIQTDSVSPTVEEMEQVLNGTYSEVESDSSSIVKLIQTYIPAAKKLMIQVEAWRKAEITSQKDKYTNEVIDDIAYENLLSRYLALASGYMVNRDSKLVILYTAPTKLDEKGNIIKYQNETKLFDSICKKNNIIFVDMTDNYCEQYEKEHMLVHGFVNTEVGSGHLNAYGHLVTAQFLAQVIREDIYNEP